MKNVKVFLLVAAATVASLSVTGCVGKGKAPPPAPAPAAVITRG